MLCSKYVDAYYEKWKSGRYVLCNKNIRLLEFLEREILPHDDIYYFDDQKIEDYIDFSETWYFELDDWEKFIVPFIFLFRAEDDEVVFDEFVIVVGRGVHVPLQIGVVFNQHNYSLTALSVHVPLQIGVVFN